MWTDEQRKEASERAKARWADPEYRKKTSEAIKKPACCPTCGETDIDKFYLDKNGHRTAKFCKNCHKEQCKKRWHKRPWLDRWSSRYYLYGVTKEFLLDLYEKQQGKCKICGMEPETSRGLHIDHCHGTGKVRGLLCHGCNVGIGSMREDPDVLSKAIEYLRSY